MRYYIAADGGGTKLQAILYDEDLHVINTAGMSGTNTILRTAEAVTEDIRRLIEQLIPREITRIEGVDLSVLKYGQAFLELLEERCTVGNHMARGEGDTALAAAGVRYGIVAQAGTGSDAFLIQPDKRATIGGWGYILGDEGSGYDVGIQTLKAAIHAFDGRGPRTSISDILMKEWKLTKLWDLVDILMGGKDYRHMVASAARVASAAAKGNDAVALGIYEEAGHELSKQVFAVIARSGGTWEGPIVASGGVWKGHPRMFETFCKDIRARYENAEIAHPMFEPVVGCAILRRFAQGEAFTDFEDALREQFRAFRYNV